MRLRGQLEHAHGLQWSRLLAIFVGFAYTCFLELTSSLGGEHPVCLPGKNLTESVTGCGHVLRIRTD